MTKRSKRKRGDDSDEDDVDGDQGGGHQDKKRADKGKEVDRSMFACPYFQYNPVKYKDWRNCVGPGWPDVARLKYAHIGDIYVVCADKKQGSICTVATDNRNTDADAAGSPSRTSRATSNTRGPLSPAF